uniref:Uncharacterized protein n=1 Tax=Cyclopterus lumpus TaxID=8103 RepID=A0A8C3A4P4_CYCLU
DYILYLLLSDHTLHYVAGSYHMIVCYTSNQALPQLMENEMGGVMRAHPAAAVDSGVRRGETTEQSRWYRVSCERSNVSSRRREASPSKRIIFRCLEVFWI